MSVAQAAALARGARMDDERDRWLARIWKNLKERHFGLPIEVTDPTDLRQTGWAIVFHEHEDDRVKQALEPLIAHRRQQLGDGRGALLKVLEYRDGDDRSTWLGRYGARTGSVLPDRVPYYLLLVGSPERIPFTFCHEIDVEYCVGFLHFPSPDDYARYAQSVIAYETGQTAAGRREVVFFGTRHDSDQATELSANELVTPLAESIPAKWNFRSRLFQGAEATKSALTSALTNPDGGPALLFTASHGLVWPKGHTSQLARQGAILCQDWPGEGYIGPEQYFAASDLSKATSVQGTIAFLFACYSAGTPLEDRFIHVPGQPPPTIADAPFIAALPRALLTHASGGALACIGHVDRAWTWSIRPRNATPQRQPFQNAIERILNGQPVGYAVRDFNESFAGLSASLLNLLEHISFNRPVQDEKLADAWIERNDAEGYLVLGDPAVRLRVDRLR